MESGKKRSRLSWLPRRQQPQVAALHRTAAMAAKAAGGYGQQQQAAWQPAAGAYARPAGQAARPTGKPSCLLPAYGQAPLVYGCAAPFRSALLVYSPPAGNMPVFLIAGMGRQRAASLRTWPSWSKAVTAWYDCFQVNYYNLIALGVLSEEYQTQKKTAAGLRMKTCRLCENKTMLATWDVDDSALPNRCGGVTSPRRVTGTATNTSSCFPRR